MHSLDHELCSTGLLRAALDYDMRAAMNRWNISGNPGELASLVPEQLLMLIIANGTPPGHPLWALAESRYGRPLPKPTP